LVTHRVQTDAVALLSVKCHHRQHNTSAKTRDVNKATRSKAKPINHKAKAADSKAKAMTFKTKVRQQFNNCNVMYNIAETMMPTVLKPEKERKKTTFQTQAESAISESNTGTVVYSHCTNRFEHHTVAVFSLGGATAR